MEKKKQVFLSYAKPDFKLAYKIYQGLTDRNLNVWFDKKCPKLGTWKPQIKNAISKSRYFIFCMSNAALERKEKGEGFQGEEFDFAYDIAIKQPESCFTIIPVRLEDCDRGDLIITSYQQFDLFENIEGELDRLAVLMGGTSLADIKAKDERTEEEKLIDSLLGKASTLYYAGNYQGSKKLLGAIVELKPDFAEAWNNRGVALGKLGKSEEELVSFNKAIELKPDFAKAWNNRGITLGKLGDSEEELANFNKAIELVPDFTEAWYNRGNALGKLAKYEEALASFNNAIKLKPDFAEAWNNRGVALGKLGKYEEALANYNKAVELKPDFTEAWYNRGVILREFRNSEEALASFNKVIELKPDDANAWYNKGVVLKKLDRQEDAKKSFSKARKLGLIV